jgi:hypothetical protein
MTTEIAILGWGSLLWESGADFDSWHDEWRLDGPVLELEFSRISKSRLGALTLVVDREHGTPNTVAWCLSTRKRSEDAIADLRCREGTELHNIHRIDVADDCPADETATAVWQWARQKKLDVVLWTGLGSNFATKIRQPFSVDSAIAYLKGRSPAAKVKAAEYIWNAPDFIRTPLRTAMQSAPWFARQNDDEGEAMQRPGPPVTKS